MASFTLYFLLALALVGACRGTQSHSIPPTERRHTIIIGERKSGDSLLVRKVINVAAVRNEVVRTDYLYDQRGKANPATISQVVAYDEQTDGTGGYPSLRQGGPGYTFANLYFISSVDRPLRFIVSIYGK